MFHLDERFGDVCFAGERASYVPPENLLDARVGGQLRRDDEVVLDGGTKQREPVRLSPVASRRCSSITVLRTGTEPCRASRRCCSGAVRNFRSSRANGLSSPDRVRANVCDPA